MRNRFFMMSTQRGVHLSCCLCGCLLLVFLCSSAAFAKTTPTSTSIPVVNQIRTSGSTTPAPILGIVNWPDAPIVAALIMLAGQGAGFLLKCMLDKRAIRRGKRENQQEQLTSNTGSLSVYRLYEESHGEYGENTLAYHGRQNSNMHLLAPPANDSIDIEASRAIQDDIVLALSSSSTTDTIPTLLDILANGQLDGPIRRGIIEALDRLIREPQHLTLLAEYMSISSEPSNDAHQVLWRASRRLNMHILYRVDHMQDTLDTHPDDS